MKHPKLRTAATIAALCISAFLNSQCNFSGLGPNYCTNSSSVTLTPANPGGTFSGPGVTGNNFNPALAGPGTHSISYQVCSGNYSLSTGTYSPVLYTGNQVFLADDDMSTAKPIGFTFNFFCQNYSNFYISSNGFITFSSGQPDGCCQGDFLPNFTNPDNLIAFAWVDLDPTSGGVIQYTTTGVSPNRKLIVSFDSVPHYGPTNPITVQVHLYETSNIIEIHTYDMTTDFNYHTMGIENSGGTTAYTITGRNSDDTWSAYTEMVRFAPDICKSTQTTVVNGPSVTVSGNTMVCPGTSATLTAGGAVSYSWNNGSNATTLVVSPSLTTTYTLGGTNLAGCSASITITVFVVPPPNITISGGPTQSICAGQSATLTGSGGTTYSWSTGSASNAIVVSPSVTTTYSVVGTVQTCTGSAVKTINIDPGPTLVVTMGSPTVCFPADATVTASGGAGYVWSSGPGSNTINAVLIVDQPVGTYVYTLTGANSNSCISTKIVSVNISACIGIAENNGSTSSLFIFPNPSSGEFSIEGTNGSAVDVFDDTGRLLRVLQLRDKRTIVKDLPKGIYFIHDRNSGQNSKVLIM